MEFTQQQLAAIQSNEKRILVLACAGSGKTSVIIGRIERLIDNGVDPQQILALTFSNKAAKEMKNRLRRKSVESGIVINVKTFHAFGLEIINSYYNTLGFTKKVEICLKDESSKIIKDIYKKRNEKIVDGNDVYEYIHKVKTSNSYVPQPSLDIIFEEYEAQLKQNNKVDMDDMLYLPIKLLNEFDNIKTAIQEKYKYIFVDEYQDTSYIQNILLDNLVGDQTNLFMVGDDDQAIYEWRGARPDYILEKANNKKYKCIKLEKNFRSQGAIIALANRIINVNKKRVSKAINQQRQEGNKPIFRRLKSEYEEANWVADQIDNLIKTNRFNASDIAIIYRNNKQVEPIKKALYDKRINYESLDIDDTSKYTRFIRFLKSVNDLSSITDLSDALNFPTRCFDNFIYQEAKSKYCDVYGQDCNYDPLTWIDKIYLSNISFENDKELRERYALITQLHESRNLSCTEIIAFIISYLERNNYNTSAFEQYECALQSFDIAKNYEEVYGTTSLNDFLEHLIMSYENNDVSAGENVEAVNILTMHRAKGLEFKVVFIIGVQVGIFPNDYFIQSEYQLECERRLFYVAITRAKELLFLSSYKDPLGGSFDNPIIRHGFIAEIPSTYFGNPLTKDDIVHKFPEKEGKENTKATDLDAKSIINSLEKAEIKEEIISPIVTEKNQVNVEHLEQNLKESILLSKNIIIPSDKFIVIIGSLDVKINVAQALLKENMIARNQVEFYDYDGKGFKINKYFCNPKCIGIILGPQAHKMENIDARSLKGKLINEEGFPFSVDLISKHISKSSLQEAIVKIKWNYHLNCEQ